MNNLSINEYLNNPSKARCNNFYDWFCRDKSLVKKEAALIKKVQKLIASDKIDADAMSVFFKNNCPMNGILYDDIRFCDIKSGDVIYTVTPRSGHKSDNGMAEVRGSENEFSSAIVYGTWRDVLNYFGVK